MTESQSWSKRWPQNRHSTAAALTSSAHIGHVFVGGGAVASGPLAGGAVAAGVAVAAGAGTVVSGGVTYYKIRGGSYTGTSGGTTCEFDFDLDRNTFANSDLGFRCCSANPP